MPPNSMPNVPNPLEPGKVYLVGAGTGQVAHLTVQAHELLRRAEVLIYDALVGDDLVALVPEGCEQIQVGKRGGELSTPQAEINRLLVAHAQQGRSVIRLKSGDPFVFGRSAAEIQALSEANCAFEVVPGLSSALSAPLLAGIPLTDPVLSRCFGVATAHEPDALDWAALSQLDTLVLLMGARQLPEIIELLLRHERGLETPIAVIRWAGQSQQQIWTGTLGSILRQTEHQPLSPAVIVIGEVVRLRPYLSGDLAAQ